MPSRAAIFLITLGVFCQTAKAQVQTPVQPQSKAQPQAQPQPKTRATRKKRAIPKTDKSAVAKQEPKTNEEVLDTVTQSTAALTEGLLAKTLNAITIDTRYGPVIPFPIIDSSKDLGPSFGVMPIIAVKQKATGIIKSVLIPSVTYNRNLGTTLTYRQYILPDDKRLFIVRASRSDHVENELMTYYYTPQLFSTSMRFGIEANHLVDGKPSFYGLGIDSKQSARANYAIDMTGEEITLDVPLVPAVFVSLDHSFYAKRVLAGPVTDDDAQLKDMFPQVYNSASDTHNFLLNRFSLVFDDTDHPTLPKLGTYASAAVQYSAKALGSDYDYRTYSFQLKNYYNHKDEGHYVTAVNYLLEFQKGETPPFYAMEQLGESTGLRMAGDGRFTDNGKVVFNIEERITLSKTPFYKFISETEIAPFLDVGTVFPHMSAFRARNLKYGPGISARLVIRPQLVTTVDFAFGSEGTNAIIRVGYPF
jgi:hypothetical protein